MEQRRRIVVRPEQRYVRRRRLAVVVLLLVVALLAWGLRALFSGDDPRPSSPSSTQTAPTKSSAAPSGSGPGSGGTSSAAKAAPGTFAVVRTNTPGVPPVAVAASGTGTVVSLDGAAGHALTAYGADGKAIDMLAAGVFTSDYGISGHDGASLGEPVAAAFAPDGTTLWVANRAVSGPGWPAAPGPDCSGKATPSLVYRVDAAKLAITKVVQVDSGPTALALTPKGKQLVVSNSCSGTLSIIDTDAAKVTKTVELGVRRPGRVALAPGGALAFVAVPGEGRVLSVALPGGKVSTFLDGLDNPVDLAMSPAGDALYVLEAGRPQVRRVSVDDGKTTARAELSGAPVAFTLTPDGTVLYAVGADPGVVAISVPQLEVVARGSIQGTPRAVAFEAQTKRLWVATDKPSLVTLAVP